MGSVLQCLALLFYIPFDGLASLYIVSALFGLAQGGIVPSYALIIRDHFPAREAGSRISLVLTATVFGMALGGWMSGKIFDVTGSYQAAFLNGIAWNVVNIAIAAWLLPAAQSGRNRRCACRSANCLPLLTAVTAEPLLFALHASSWGKAHGGNRSSSTGSAAAVPKAMPA